MSVQYTSVKVVRDIVEETIKPSRPGRSYLLIENRSASAIYINFDTHASVSNGIEIASGGNYEREVSVPDNYIYIIGSQLTDQFVNVTEGFV